MFKNNENLGLTPLDCRAIFDVSCEGANGEQFIVEMQRTRQAFFKDRSLFYATFPIQEQSNRGDWDYRVPPAYSVSILDFVMTQSSQELKIKKQNTFIHHAQLTDQDGDCFYDKLAFIYIELPKFKKSLDQLSSHEDKWFYLFRHLSELGDRPQPLTEPIFDHLFEVAEIANFSNDEQDNYQAALKAYRDLQNVVNTAIEEAEKKAEKRGRQKGREWIGFPSIFLECPLGYTPIQNLSLPPMPKSVTDDSLVLAKCQSDRAHINRILLIGS